MEGDILLVLRTELLTLKRTNALYKSAHDARKRLKRGLREAGYGGQDIPPQAAKATTSDIKITREGMWCFLDSESIKASSSRAPVHSATRLAPFPLLARDKRACAARSGEQGG